MCTANRMEVLHYGYARHNWDVKLVQFQGGLKVNILVIREIISASKLVANSSRLVVSTHLHIALWADNFLHQNFDPDSLPASIRSRSTDKAVDLSRNGLYSTGKLDCHDSIWGPLLSTERTNLFPSVYPNSVCQ